MDDELTQKFTITGIVWRDGVDSAGNYITKEAIDEMALLKHGPIPVLTNFDQNALSIGKATCEVTEKGSLTTMELIDKINGLEQLVVRPLVQVLESHTEEKDGQEIRVITKGVLLATSLVLRTEALALPEDLTTSPVKTVG